MILLPWHQSSASFSRTRATSRVMGLVRTTKYLSYFLVLLSSFCLELGHATDTIAAPNFINDSETIISNDGEFILGFFSPSNSRYRYVGIWYAKLSTNHAIWVANRNKPLKTTSGILTISDDGNLVILDGEKKIIWSSNVTGSVSNRSAQLLDSGNLVLQENTKTSIMWESFQHPSDSFLSKMKMSTNIITGEKVQFTSWKSQSDPAVGAFFVGIYVFNLPEIFIWNDINKPYWRSGPWNGRIFIGMPSTLYSLYLERFGLVEDNEGTISSTFYFSNESRLLYYTLTSEGNFEEISSINGKDWGLTWSSFKSECDIYGKCGAFGSCYSQNSPICSCLKGFEPKNLAEWNVRNWTSGCVRRTPLQCKTLMSTGGEEGKKDGFLKVKMMKTPDFANWSSSFEDECRYQCLEKCSCIAYAYESGIGCMSWSSDLIDSQKLSTGGVDLYVRVAYSELEASSKHKLRFIIPIGVVGIAVISLGIIMCSVKRRRSSSNTTVGVKRDAKNDHIDAEKMIIKSYGSVGPKRYTYSAVKKLTNSFKDKIGRGGYGVVYKGKLPDGRVVAVKVLSESKGNGEEFINEVASISGTSHVNIVTLLGFCYEKTKRALIYEFVPNGSLDKFIYDDGSSITKCHLDKTIMFQIALGIARGLDYLHRGCRTRILHLDIKPHNILLGEDLCPKISDFGLAKLCKTKESIVSMTGMRGTVGYIAPEVFSRSFGGVSHKSDVYSYGMLVLEMVGGRKNYDGGVSHTSEIYFPQWIYNKLERGEIFYTREDRREDEEDIVKREVEEDIVKRMIIVSLWCIQTNPLDRPSMGKVIEMLECNFQSLQIPPKPFLNSPAARSLENSSSA